MSRIVAYFGQPGAGKTTAARAWVEAHHPAVLLDGDVVRTACEDTDFSRDGRARQVRRIAKLAHALSEFGVNVAIAVCAPEYSSRAAAQVHCPGIEWEYVATPRSVCQQRRPDLPWDQIPDTQPG